MAPNEGGEKVLLEEENGVSNSIEADMTETIASDYTIDYTSDYNTDYTYSTDGASDPMSRIIYGIGPDCWDLHGNKCSRSPTHGGCGGSWEGKPWCWLEGQWNQKWGHCRPEKCSSPRDQFDH